MSKNSYTYQLEAELKDFKPRIWRRFLIDSSSSLADLGYALVAMFEGQASHLFHFWHPKDYGLCYECACYEPVENLGFGPIHFKAVDARSITLAKALPEVGSVINFEYDFGDSWDFKIKLKKIIGGPHELEVIGGAGYGIIEDCGGVSGLNHIVELCKNRCGREYEEFVAWSGLVEFDIKEFDCLQMNKGLIEYAEMIKAAYEEIPC